MSVYLFLWVGKGGRLLHNVFPAIAYLSPVYCVPVSRLLCTCLPAIAYLSPGYCIPVSRLLHTYLTANAYLSPGYCIPVSLHPLDVSCPAVLLSLNLSKRKNILFNPFLNFRFVLEDTPVPVAARSKAWVCDRSLAGFVG
jgi:hypothetical protein